MKKFFSCVVLTLCMLLGFGIDAVNAGALTESVSQNLKIQQWQGHNFTFMSLPDDKQAAGYSIFKAENASRGFQGDVAVRIPYATHVGKQAVVTDVVPFDAGYGIREYMVYLTVVDTGEKLVARSMRSQVNGLVLTADLKNARKQFMGKTVYSKLRELPGLATAGNPMPQAVSVGIGAPVVVTDVYPGIQIQDPIWLVVTAANGQKAVLPMNYSWTNMPQVFWNDRPAWQDDLFLEDPHKTFNWSSDMWKQIETANVTVGMFKEQVRLSWGEASDMEQDGFVWIYGDKKLTFNGDILISIATRS
ncbi:hypothetical protein [Anaeroarcus burkinensis]|uniref:hypothetical protein n=1 Tax=Anaeroarcus burkinensis TaxID=82376 RepID=UPI000411D6D4|nr:hypothetical protein [Anaeroarcus burkinensis]